MGVMIGVAVGYVLGTRAGAEGYEELVRAVRTITSSGELKELAVGAAGLLADVLKGGTSALGEGTEAKLRRIA